MKGFSIIELIVVVAIIGILAAIGVISYSGYTSTTKKSNAKNNLRSIYMVQEEYKANEGKYYFTESGSSCGSDKNSSINTDLFDETEVLPNKQKEYKYCIASDNSGVSYKAYAIEISDPSITFTINEKNSLE